MAKNELKIKGCDFWGNYKGFKVYKCYSKTAPKDYDGIVFAVGNDLYLAGTWIGRVTDGGSVTDWYPEKAQTKRVVEEKEVKVDEGDVDKVLANSWKRTVDDLISHRFSVDNIKYSE